ncbi:hypothetical protein KAI46_05470 [bacterium]|nr:hypothetical protein [bacterium]
MVTNKFIIILIALITLAGCGERGGMGGLLTPADVLIIKHHVRQHYICLEEFCRRLYLKNPKYEPNRVKQAEKLKTIFHDQNNLGSLLNSPYDKLASHEILAAAFAKDTLVKDRIALLALGLKKSIGEGYRQDVLDNTMVTSLQVPLERLKKLYSNLSQVNWRLKIYHDQQEKLYFLTNEKSPEGHLNMGYEVLMTKVLTRIEDDIYMRGGNPPHEIFRMSTMFFSLFL